MPLIHKSTSTLSAHGNFGTALKNISASLASTVVQGANISETTLGQKRESNRESYTKPRIPKPSAHTGSTVAREKEEPLARFLALTLRIFDVCNGTAVLSRLADAS